MHISTLTSTLVLLIACVGFNNAQFDRNDYTTPVCCTGQNIQANCPARTCAQTWWGPEGDCSTTYGPIACKNSKFVGYTRNSDRVTWSWVDQAELEQRWQVRLQPCYLGDQQVYNGEMRCVVPPNGCGAAGADSLADSKAAQKGGNLGGALKAQAAKNGPTKMADGPN